MAGLAQLAADRGDVHEHILAVRDGAVVLRAVALQVLEGQSLREDLAHRREGQLHALHVAQQLVVLEVDEARPQGNQELVDPPHFTQEGSCRAVDVELGCALVGRSQVFVDLSDHAVRTDVDALELSAELVGARVLQLLVDHLPVSQDLPHRVA